MEDKVFCHTCCQAVKQRIAIHRWIIFMVCSYALFQVSYMHMIICFVLTYSYRIAGFFEDKIFHEFASPRFSRGKFSRIVTDCKEYLLKSKHFEGKIFMNCF